MQFWLDGGWGVDVLYGQQTSLEILTLILMPIIQTNSLIFCRREDIKLKTNWLSTSVELYSKELGYIDIHPFVLNADGTSKQADFGWRLV